MQMTNNTEAEKSSLKEDSIRDLVGKALAKAAPKEHSDVELLKSDKISNEGSVLDKVEEFSSHKEMNIVLKKSLTDREQMVFEYFLNNVGKTVYAKDLAELLDLPRDYVYKYIKNLRAKIEGDKLKNDPSGGFILSE